ncbi:MAG: PEP-CTERM sorting domain-containing protein [Armatimonadota bacterium]
MKVTKVVLIVAVLVMALAVSAMASETNWKFFANTTGNPTGIRVGTLSTAGANSASVNLVTGTGCAIYDLAAPTYGTTNLLSIDMTAPITEGTSRAWTMLVWAGKSFTGSSITVNWHDGGSSYPLPTKIGNTEYSFKLKVVTDPTGTYAVGTEWTFPTTLYNSGSYSASPIVFNKNISSIMYNQKSITDLSPATGANGAQAIKLQISMAPTVPEPGSMLALATGLIGLAGGIIRRKK